MARPKTRAADGLKPYRVAIGTPSTINYPQYTGTPTARRCLAFEYALASDAIARAIKTLSEFEDAGRRFDHDLMTRASNARGIIRTATLTTEPIEVSLRDRGMTTIIRVWKEE